MLSWTRSLLSNAATDNPSAAVGPSSRQNPQTELVRSLEESGIDVKAILCSSSSTALDALAATFKPSPTTSPTPHSTLALHLATLFDPCPVPVSSNSTSNSSSPAASPEDLILRLSLNLLLGLDSPITISGRGEVEEDLAMRLVQLFVKGKVRPTMPLVPSDALEAFERLAGMLLGGKRITGGGTSVWKLTESVVGRLEGRLAAGGEPSSPRLARIRINLTYLLALFSSSPTESSSSSLNPRTAHLFTSIIHLGLASPDRILGAVPSLPTATSSPDFLFVAHASSLIWKSRRRLELGGRLSAALTGLPDDGGGYERWSGDAVEKARVAEKSMLLNRRLAALRKGGLTRTEYGIVDDGEGEGKGELLAAPRRLKGKKIIQQRKGKFVPSLCSPSQSSSSSTCSSSAGIRTPPSPSSALERSSPHHYHSTTFFPSSRRHDLSTTSLPSLQKKSSMDLLALNFSPPCSAAALRRPLPASFSQSLTPPHSTVPPLKSATPIPLPTVLDSHGIFSPAGQTMSMGESLLARPSSPPCEPPPPASSLIFRAVRSVADLQKRISIFAFPKDEDFLDETQDFEAFREETPPSHIRPSSSTSSSSTIRPSTSQPFSPAFTVASLPSTTAIPTSPQKAQIPILAFQPASHYDQDFPPHPHCDTPYCEASTDGGRIWRPLSPRGDRIRAKFQL